MRGNVLVITACECVWRSTIDIIRPFLSLYVLDLGGSYETIGLIMAVGNLASLVFYPLGGYIADYQGRIKLIAYMTFAYGAAFLIPAFQSLFADIIPRERRGQVLASIGGGGIWLMRGAWGSGVLGRSIQTVGSLLSGYLYGYDSSLPWLVLSGALLVLGVMFIVFVKEPEQAEI